MSRKRLALLFMAFVVGGCIGEEASAPTATVDITPPPVDLTTTTTAEAASNTAAAVTATSTPSPEFPDQPEGVDWPTDEWFETELPEDLDALAIDRATDLAFNDGGTDRLRAVVIVHEGAIVYERYSPNDVDGPEEVMPAYSIAKSVTSAVIGTLVRDGRLAVGDPAAVPEWHEDPADPRASITLDHMLHMSTGMEWQDGLDPGTTMSEMLATDDMAAYAAAQQPTWAPGEHFEYNTGTTTLLARMVGDTIEADPAGVRSYLEIELFDRIGMDPIRTQFDPAGTWLGGFSADTTARDYAKFGLLYLRGGRWDGDRVLPENWIEYSRTPSPANPEYGAHWWLDLERPSVMYAVGLGGQTITVDPDHDLVIVQLATVGGPLVLEHTETILGAFAALEHES